MLSGLSVISQVCVINRGQKSKLRKSNFETSLSQKKLEIPSFAVFKNNFIASQRLQKSLHFKELPLKTNLSPLPPVSANEAFIIFEKFKSGNYLDLNGDTKDETARNIRHENLMFLENVTNSRDKLMFISLYSTLTGFPNMKKVAQNIENQFITASNKTQNFLQQEFSMFQSSYKIIGLGYDGISSVARNTAFPGSDLDKAYVILQGNDNDISNEITVKNFKWRLWENTDQRILSYNHDPSSFPKIYTLKQITAIANAINKAVKEMDLNTKEPIPQTFFEKFMGNQRFKPSKYEEYKKATLNYSDDYCMVNKFFIDLAMRFPKKGTWKKPLDVNFIHREDVYEASFILEAMVKGKKLMPFDLSHLLCPEAKELLNLSQISAIKSNNTPKEKYQKRTTLEKDFPLWSIDAQYNFIKNMIKASCSDNTEYPEYYKSNEVDKYNSLMKKLGLADND